MAQSIPIRGVGALRLGQPPAPQRKPLGLVQQNQLCNRFAWAWKLASLGVPVVLIYLGFLDAVEMEPRALASGNEWRQAVLEHSKGVVPEDAWEQIHEVGDTRLVALIRAARIQAVIAG